MKTKTWLSTIACGVALIGLTAACGGGAPTPENACKAWARLNNTSLSGSNLEACVGNMSQLTEDQRACMIGARDVNAAMACQR